MGPASKVVGPGRSVRPRHFDTSAWKNFNVPTSDVIGVRDVKMIGVLLSVDWQSCLGHSLHECSNKWKKRPVRLLVWHFLQDRPRQVDPENNEFKPVRSVYPMHFLESHIFVNVSTFCRVVECRGWKKWVSSTPFTDWLIWPSPNRWHWPDESLFSSRKLSIQCTCLLRALTETTTDRGDYHQMM